MNILITGFNPFDGRAENMSLEVLKALNDVETLPLDVLFKTAFKSLEKHLKQHHYDYIICLGEGPNQVINLEHIALNIMHSRIPDNATYQPLNEIIHPHGALALSSSLPIHMISEHLANSNHLFNNSFHAGTYVCNDIFYRLMDLNISTPRGFIHVPHDKQYLDVSIKAIQAIIDFLKQKKD